MFKPKPIQDNRYNPYDILGIPPGSSIQIIQKAYKIMAYKTHPDNGGSDMLFNLVNKAYKYLVNDYKTKQADKQHNQLKNGYTNYKEQTPQVQPLKNYNKKSFNEIYDENRLQSINDDGYGNWIEDNQMREVDESVKQPIRNFNINNFHNKFNKVKTKTTKNMIIYEEPAILSTSMGAYGNVEELGIDQVSDYTSSVDIMSKSKIQFTDYKKAHTETHLINPNSIKYKKYNNVKHLQQSRGNIRYIMTEEELRNKHIIDKQEQIKEDNRRNRLLHNDQKHFAHYDKTHASMLQYLRN